MPSANALWFRRPAVAAVTSIVVLAILSKLAIDKYRQLDAQECIATGGKTFAYLRLGRADNKDATPKQWSVIKVGNCPLHDLQMRVADMDVPDERGWNVFSSTWTEINTPSLAFTDSGALGTDKYYRIFFTARNGSWHQDLIIDQGRSATTRVFSSRGKLMFEHQDDPSLSPQWRP